MRGLHPQASLVYGEVIEYFSGRSDFTGRKQALQELLLYVHPHLPTLDILEQYAEIRRTLRPPIGPGPIGDIDTVIATTAIVRGLTVVTTDSDFQRVPGLSTLLVDRA